LLLLLISTPEVTLLPFGRTSCSSLKRRRKDGAASVAKRIPRSEDFARNEGGLGKGVGEVVGVQAVFDDDGHGAGETGKLACAGIGDDVDMHLVRTIGHGAAVLEDKSAGASVKGATGALHSNIASGTFVGTASGEHFSLADSFEITMKLFIEGHAAEGVVVEFECGFERSNVHFECAGGVLRHGGFLLLWILYRKQEERQN